jgi:1-acyl-sn-glycerol-3-phosphate acyltransferase
MAWLVLAPMVRFGGARIPVPQRIVPARPGNLILMNHQSVFDIPLVVQTVDHGYPRIVTRTRYNSAIPLISHMVRLYQYPVVDAAANKHALRETLASLERVGRESDVPIAVFPEGTRTVAGEIGHFKRGALSRLLAARDWTVYVFVADGFWKTARFADLVSGMGDIEGSFVHAGTLTWPDPTADSGPFIEQVRQLMQDALAEIRREKSVA